MKAPINQEMKNTPFTEEMKALPLVNKEMKNTPVTEEMTNNMV